MKEKLPQPKGRIEITLEKAGEEPKVVKINNALTANSKKIMLKAMEEPGWQLDTIRVFDSAVSVAEAQVTDTTYIDYELTVVAVFDEASFNGTIDEFNLVTSKDDSIFSEVTGQSITKSADYKMTVAWKLSF